ncbi:MAG: CTP-dependent riboflavin kinase [Acidobacteria bacterium]|nr:CTP-dependent riboflavin kinase [Acidobacteriota bacterium]
MLIQGEVVSGIGQGARFLALDWVAAQLQQQFGLTPFPGTLNLRVSAEIRQRLFEQRQEFLRIADPASPDCPGYLRKASLRANGRRYESAYLILPEKTMHEDVLEIIAAVSLRDALALHDGNAIELELGRD